MSRGIENRAETVKTQDSPWRVTSVSFVPSPLLTEPQSGSSDLLFSLLKPVLPSCWEETTTCRREKRFRERVQHPHTFFSITTWHVPFANPETFMVSSGYKDLIYTVHAKQKRTLVFRIKHDFKAANITNRNQEKKLKSYQ